MSSVFSRIVCGVDGSEAGREAVAQARRLATKESDVVVVSVSETRLAMHAGLMARKAAGDIDADARAALEQVAAEGVELRLVHGRADEAMLAATEGATLVVVGSHEKPRGKGMLLGSVATRLVHDAPCSVLIARAAPEPKHFPQSIAVGVDGSPASLSAAVAATELGVRLGASVTIIAATASASDIDLNELEDSGLSFDRTDAKPLPALLQASESVDLLVVASRGLRGLRALGSVSERVAHQAACSVLIVRLPTQ
jgi:nucleotide-binding universal stress UspA family protein